MKKKQKKGLSVCCFSRMRKNALSSFCRVMSFSRFFYYARRVLSFSRSDAMLFSSLLEREKLFSPKNKGALCSLSLSLSLRERDFETRRRTMERLLVGRGASYRGAAAAPSSSSWVFFACLFFLACFFVLLGKGAEKLEIFCHRNDGKRRVGGRIQLGVGESARDGRAEDFSGGGVVDKIKEARETFWKSVFVMTRGKEEEEEEEESIDGISKKKAMRQQQQDEDFDEEEESATNADDPSLMKAELPKSYEKALRKDIEKMLRKMPKFTNKTLK